MGHVNGQLILKNPRKPELEAIKTLALADSGAAYLCIPEWVCRQLELETAESRQVILADGSRQSVPFVGPIRVEFKDRYCFVGALVMGDEVLLGALPMEDMDLVLSMRHQTVDVNPLCSGDLVVGVKRVA